MRPIKFRGFGSKKLFSEEKWYYGSLIIVCGEYGIHPPLIQLTDKVIPETVGQFITKDKTENDAYEGDIFLWHGEKYLICYDERNFHYYGKCLDNSRADISLPPGGEFEIIGNIHDNPELVQGVRNA